MDGFSAVLCETANLKAKPMSLNLADMKENQFRWENLHGTARAVMTGEWIGKKIINSQQMQICINAPVDQLRHKSTYASHRLLDWTRKITETS